MTRIEKIRQMPDDELAEFLNMVAALNEHVVMPKEPNAVRNMTDVELANYMSDLDGCDHLRICTGGCPIEVATDCKDMCSECSLRWLREEGPLMDGVGV